MKQLTWKLVLPLTVISFTVFTKWWYVKIDNFSEVLGGFPLPFVCPGWHTSLSLQIFILEFIVDILSYFAFWFFVIFAATKIIKQFRVPKSVITTLITISVFVTVVTALVITINRDNIYTITREFNIEIIETGYRFIWQEEVRTDYHPDSIKTQ